jgi:preprotein translocase subunit SecG
MKEYCPHASSCSKVYRAASAGIILSVHSIKKAMKKLTSFLIGMFFISMAVHAQSNDSTRSQNSSSERRQQPSNQFKQQDYTLIQTADIPESLRKTLQNNEYAGWETGKVYESKNKDGYWVRISTGSDVQNFFFDKNGRSINAKGPGVGKSPE